MNCLRVINYFLISEANAIGISTNKYLPDFKYTIYMYICINIYIHMCVCHILVVGYLKKDDYVKI